MGEENGRDVTAPTGAPPKADQHTQGEGMTNGIPDALGQDRATAMPHSEREESEAAAGGRDPGVSDG